MLSFLLFLFHFSSSRKTDNRVLQYKKQYEQNPTNENAEQAILWSLAELARSVDKSITADEVESEIGYKLHEVVEKADIINVAIKKEFNQMRFEFMQAKDSMLQLIESSKQQLNEEMQNFKQELETALKSLVETSDEAKDIFANTVEQNSRATYSKLKNASIRNSVIFFVFFQGALLCGIIFYKKLDKQLRTLLI